MNTNTAIMWHATNSVSTARYAYKFINNPQLFQRSDLLHNCIQMVCACKPLCTTEFRQKGINQKSFRTHTHTHTHTHKHMHTHAHTHTHKHMHTHRLAQPDTDRHLISEGFYPKLWWHWPSGRLCCHRAAERCPGQSSSSQGHQPHLKTTGDANKWYQATPHSNHPQEWIRVYEGIASSCLRSNMRRVWIFAESVLIIRLASACQTLW